MNVEEKNRLDRAICRLPETPKLPWWTRLRLWWKWRTIRRLLEKSKKG